MLHGEWSTKNVHRLNKRRTMDADDFHFIFPIVQIYILLLWKIISRFSRHCVFLYDEIFNSFKQTSEKL